MKQCGGEYGDNVLDNQEEYTQEKNRNINDLHGAIDLDGSTVSALPINEGALEGNPYTRNRATEIEVTGVFFVAVIL